MGSHIETLVTLMSLCEKLIKSFSHFRQSFQNALNFAVMHRYTYTLNQNDKTVLLNRFLQCACKHGILEKKLTRFSPWPLTYALTAFLNHDSAKSAARNVLDKIPFRCKIASITSLSVCNCISIYRYSVNKMIRK